MILRIIIWGMFLIGGSFLSVYFDLKFVFTRNLLVNFWWHFVTLPIGAVLLWVVIRISRYTGRLLAHYGREGDNVAPMETNKLVTADVYSCMRHPMHLVLFFFPLSFALIEGSFVFIFIVVPAEILIILFLIKFIEEPGAIKKFGSSYREYMNKVPMFSFKKECLKKMIFDKPLPDSRKN